jgi:hypothetical protein
MLEEPDYITGMPDVAALERGALDNRVVEACTR